MENGSAAARGKVELAWICLGVSDQLGNGRGWNGWIGDHHEGLTDAARDRRDVADKIVVQVVVECRVYRVRCSNQKERMAVGRGLHDSIGADIATCTRSVVDDEGLS